MSTPDFMPILSAGSHKTPETGACFMEFASYLAGERFSDSPACTHPALAAAARNINDHMSDDERQGLLPLIPRFVGANSGDPVVSVRLAVWSARSVLHTAPEVHRGLAEAAIEAAEAWCDDPSPLNRANAKARGRALRLYVAALNRRQRVGTHAIIAAANAADDRPHGGAAAAASYAAIASPAAVTWLTELIDEFDRLTGRAPSEPLTDDQRRDMAALIGALS